MCIEVVSKYVSTIYYILMFTISATTLAIAIVKLFPKIKCRYNVANNNGQDGIDIYFINLRSRTVIIDKIKFVQEGNVINIKHVSNCKIISQQDARYFQQVNFSDNYIKVIVEDIEGNKYVAKRIK
ncbi:MAG: hypothetical protein J1F65_00840 [Clostridiales bacterium]|nr:hypothetical protein [Clostridiales bacterium]